MCLRCLSDVLFREFSIMLRNLANLEDVYAGEARCSTDYIVSSFFKIVQTFPGVLRLKCCIITHRRSVAKSIGRFQRRLFVYLFVNTITSERVNIWWWNLGDKYTVQKSWPSSKLGVIAPGCAHPQNVALGYDVGKISEGCLVLRLDLRTHITAVIDRSRDYTLFPRLYLWNFSSHARHVLY